MRRGSQYARVCQRRQDTRAVVAHVADSPADGELEGERKGRDKLQQGGGDVLHWFVLVPRHLPRRFRRSAQRMP
jgi:hypothetical protein